MNNTTEVTTEVTTEAQAQADAPKLTKSAAKSLKLGSAINEILVKGREAEKTKIRLMQAAGYKGTESGEAKNQIQAAVKFLPEQVKQAVERDVVTKETIRLADVYFQLKNALKKAGITVA